MTIISDTSVITNLMQIGQVDILPAVFGNIIIPEAVFDELAMLDEQRLAISKMGWLEIRPALDHDLVSQLCQTIDLGESEAIALAIETHADWLLMDERKGREKAKELGIPVTGLLGVLLKAKANGAFPNVRPIMDGLIAKSGFRIHGQLYKEIIRLAGEG